MKTSLKKSKYLEIAEVLMENIVKGRLVPGEKIPSVRETAIHMGVTPNTAANAHNQLRNMGVIKPVHGKGSVIVQDAPEICRLYMEKQFIEHEMPVFRQRVALLGLSKEQILRLLQETQSLTGKRMEQDR